MRRVLAIVATVALMAGGLYGSYGYLHHPHRQEADAMAAVLKRSLPAGATIAQTMGVLRGPAVGRFLSTHHFWSMEGERWPLRHVSHYDEGLDGLQLYPAGASLTLTVSSNPYGRVMPLRFDFGRHGRLTGFTVNEFGTDVLW